ncbi:MAG TPA: dTDP-4-dehydrorhamnose 3,5-epimerase [Vicinamibacterales bacterium]|nr:dTDP-4-dehydrorhamnose 3,5-epimerase [Vicinamibacterales bacterium]
MKFIETAIPGVFIIDSVAFDDDRGTFVPAWLPDEFTARGLSTNIAQASLVRTHRRGTIRGVHFQADPFAEAKTIRVIRGAVFDVAVDLRPDSPTYRRWVGCELSDANRRMLYLPVGCAHGYQTLVDDTDVLYFVSAPYSPPHQRGVRWNDPALGIQWPLGPPTSINERDATYPLLDPPPAT